MRGAAGWVGRWAVGAVVVVCSASPPTEMVQARSQGQSGLDDLKKVRDDQSFDALVAPATGTTLAEAEGHFRAQPPPLTRSIRLALAPMGLEPSAMIASSAVHAATRPRPRPGVCRWRGHQRVERLASAPLEVSSRFAPGCGPAPFVGGEAEPDDDHAPDRPRTHPIRPRRAMGGHPRSRWFTDR